MNHLSQIAIYDDPIDPIASDTSVTDFAKAAKTAPPPVRATFDGNGELDVRGDTTPNTITVGRDAAGTILVNDGTVPITGGPATVDNTTEISVTGRAGDDVLTVENSTGALPHVTLDGGAGNDTINGGNGDDLLIGGAGDDVVTGGRGSDTAQLGTGDDTFVWNPGDGSDVVKGGAGNDTLQFNDANIAEKVDLSDVSGHAILARDVGNVTMDLDGMETINITARGGADTFNVHDLTHTDVQTLNIDLAGIAGTGAGDLSVDTVSLEGGARGTTITATTSNGTTVVTGLGAEVHITGADANDGVVDQLSIAGGAGNDTIDAHLLNGMGLTVDGGAGNDTIIGSRGADTLLGGDGNDTFVWNPGDGSDTLQGGAGTDRMLFNGSNIGENINISANGSDATFTRDVANITMSLNGVETVDFNALLGADNVFVNDLTGTEVKNVNIDLGATIGGTGDGVADTVNVAGTAANDSVSIATVNGETRVTGLAADVHVNGADNGLDQLVINTQAGDDVIDATHADPHGMLLAINAGAGNDTITGSANDDLINGGQGSDTAFMGGGNDTFVWNPGDGSDVVDGGVGSDTMQFNDANIAENVDISANGGHATLFRNVGNVTMDMTGIEQINLVARGGADNVTVHDMTGTDVKVVDIDLGATPGQPGGDGAVDSIFLEGTAGSDSIHVSIQNGVLVIDGLATEVRIHNFEGGPNGDQIHIAGLGGDDVIEGATMPADGPQLFFDGGEGNDVLIGGAGNDTLLGGLGDDVLEGGPGQDVLDGGPGNNVLIQ